MRFARQWMVFGLAFAVLASLAPAARAQMSTGNIYGVVSDAQGAVLPGVTATLAGDLGELEGAEAQRCTS